MADLTTKEKVSGAFVVILSTAIVGTTLFLVSTFLARYELPEKKGPAKPPAHGRPGNRPEPPAPKAAAKVEIRPVDSWQFWTVLFTTLGLGFLSPMAALGVGCLVGFMYGLVCMLVACYDLSDPAHCLALFVDLTWAQSTTLLGFVIIHQIYLIAFGLPDRGKSQGKGWISFIGSVGGSVLQTWGTVNVGGQGAHEHIHLLQTRILGPVFIPLHVANYVILGLIQILGFLLFGWWACWILHWRDSAWFRPAADSVVKSPAGKSGPGDFFGWIYRYTLMEIWGYGGV